MPSFNQTKFNDFILDNGIVGFFPKPIKLVSGRESSWYVNWRNIANDAYLMSELINYLLAFIAKEKLEFETIYGTPDGATKLAVLAQYEWAKAQDNFSAGNYVLSMGRKTPKDHGEIKDRFFVGEPRGKTIILEDVTTTGGSLLKSAKVLLSQGVQLHVAIALTNRNENMDDERHVSEALKELGVEYYAMSNALDLLPAMLERFRKSITEEFVEYGEKKIKL